MTPTSDPKSFTTYRIEPNGWAACHKKTGHAERITEAQAKTIHEANTKPEPKP